MYVTQDGRIIEIASKTSDDKKSNANDIKDIGKKVENQKGEK